jgi:hypothetical protein
MPTVRAGAGSGLLKSRRLPIANLCLWQFCAGAVTASRSSLAFSSARAARDKSSRTPLHVALEMGEEAAAALMVCRLVDALLVCP